MVEITTIRHPLTTTTTSTKFARCCCFVSELRSLFILSFIISCLFTTLHDNVNLIGYVTTTKELHQRSDVILDNYRRAYEDSFGLFSDTLTEEEWQRLRDDVRNFRELHAIPHQFYYDASRWHVTIQPPQQHSGGDIRRPSSSSRPETTLLPVEFTCPEITRIKAYEQQRHDPGHAICSPRSISRQVAHRQLEGSNGCLVYAAYATSTGFGGIFENAIRDAITRHDDRTKCIVHVLSPEDKLGGDLLVPRSVKLHQWGLRGSNAPHPPDGKFLSFQQTVAALGHRYHVIDVFLVDCDGCEWLTYGDWMDTDVIINQIVVRTRNERGGGDDDAMIHPVGFFETLKRQGYVNFHTSVGEENGRVVVEYSFLKLKKSFFEKADIVGKNNDNEITSTWSPAIYGVPGDLWKMSSLTFQPVSLPNCCMHPLAHKRTPTTSKRFSKECLSSDDLKDMPSLRYKGPGHQYSPYNLLTTIHSLKGDLILLGDSTTKQWFEQLSCYLGAFDSWTGFAKPPISANRGVLEDEIYNLLSRQYVSTWKKRGNLGTLNGYDDSAFGSFYLEGALDKRAGQRVMYHGVNNLSLMEIKELLSFYDDVYPVEFQLERPVFVINIGLHYNNHGEEVSSAETDAEIDDGRSQLRRDLKVLIRHCRTIGAKCIFRESTPQHFDTPRGDGLYVRSPDVERQCLLSPPPFFWTLNRWRVEALHSAMMQELQVAERKAEEEKQQRMAKGDNNNDPSSSFEGRGGREQDDEERRTAQRNKQGFLKIMPLFDRVAFLSYAHGKSYHGKADCTHFAMNPEFWEPWHVSLTSVLKEVVNDESSNEMMKGVTN